ncbi:larval cuticle protein A2B-like [Neodiprion pinetum]|uniref:Larval cuticle protein A3A-like n=1 Tax=Neodiprion lecontei TaxID=441921 RepID=A0A6J0BG21_NEOLC|nr:larval cuticle protein A3A-like [Neodiprion lecontei]XP_046426680.1 larval cuticle protein A3A-like [Neodiprion fabricii]XP_046483230.1 larval cuticle protein A3A-like [Neodiprion pinetum]XP_046622024.1 larval cuticle protein A3A-like [Neodiprion virginianus]
MAFKLIALAALVAAANAGVIAPAPVAYHAAPAYGYAAPIAKAVVKTIDADYDPNPQYSYSYDVHDSITGDVKSQEETRNGDAVQGSYSLIEADGTRRIVHYTADPHNGFNAVVEKEGTPNAHPVVAKYAAPAYPKYAPAVKVAAPVAHAYAAPVAHAYAAPVAHAYAAPVSHGYAAPAAHVSYSAPSHGYQH